VDDFIKRLKKVRDKNIYDIMESIPEMWLVQVNRYEIPIANLPTSFHGFTIARLTDLHLGFLVSESVIRGIVHRTNTLRTDLVVC